MEETEITREDGPAETPAETDTAGAEKPAAEKPRKKKRTAKDYAIRFFVRIGVTALVIFLLLKFVAGVYVNHTNSSYPMIKDGDLCLTFKLGELKQGDVAAYEQNGEMRFGRVLAVAGDKVEINNDYAAVNGYGVFEDTVYGTTAEGSKISYPYTVPEGTVFLLNDFRSDISDSRTYGGIKLEDCYGKVIFIMRRRGI